MTEVIPKTMEELHSLYNTEWINITELGRKADCAMGTSMAHNELRRWYHRHYSRLLTQFGNGSFITRYTYTPANIDDRKLLKLKSKIPSLISTDPLFWKS